MQDLPPLMNVILNGHRNASERVNDHHHSANTYKCEYTPGIRASSIAVGRGLSQRSGFHSFASSPHSALLLLLAWKCAKTETPLFTTTSFMSVPSRPRMGSENGSTTSFVALEMEDAIESDGQYTPVLAVEETNVRAAR